MQLRRCFLTAGKGRRPTPLQLTAGTVAVLLQLNRLRVEGGKTFKDVGDWFSRLFPQTCRSSKRLKTQIQQCVAKSEKLPFDDLSAVLNECVDVESIDDILSTVSINWKTVCSQELFQPHLDVTVTNSVVISLENFRSRQKLKFSFLLDWLQRLGKTTAAHFDSKTIGTVISDYKNLSQNKSSNPEAFRMPLYGI